MTTRKNPLVIVLDNTGSHLGRLEKSLGKKKTNKKISVEKKKKSIIFGFPYLVFEVVR